MKKLTFTLIGFAFLVNVSAQIKINSSGQVGIGTSTVSNDQNWERVLDVYSSNFAKLLVRSSNVKTGIFSHNSWNGTTAGRIGTESTHDLRLTAGYGNDVMILRTNGNVGIGITPSYKLEVNGVTRSSGFIGSYLNFIPNDNFTYDGKTVGQYALNWQSDSWHTASTTLWLTAHGGMKFFTAGSPRLFIHNNGNIGIGKAPATNRKLDVAGNAYANDILLTSDERLKTDIKPLSNEKEKLYLLQGKSYKKILPSTGLEEDSLTEKKETIEFPGYGYLAQELKEIFPDLAEQGSDGYYAVNYIGLIPIIVEALKDQRLEIDEKQSQIDKQQSQIDEQREQIKQLIKLMDIKSINEDVFRESGIESIPLLLQNTPNPFNETTEIGYFIPETVRSANIYIYDVNGFQQKSISIIERGKGATTLQASALRAGIYFYTLICDGKPVDTKQMILTK